MTSEVADEIGRYLRTGDTDAHHRAWPAHSFMARALEARDDLRGALICKVLARSEGASIPDLPTPDEFPCVVHKVAHIFHNCKRETVGLPHTRRREWLLDIEFRKRETFAYSCEAFARIVERARGSGHRAELVEAFAADFRPSEERIDAVEVSDIVREATSRRNGWEVILARCAPRRLRRMRDEHATSTADAPLLPPRLPHP